MSASEKLKALAAVMDGPQTYGPEPIEASMAIDRLVDALDQIVAVVEAAEEVVPFLPPARQWLHKSLAALDEVLS